MTTCGFYRSPLPGRGIARAANEVPPRKGSSPPRILFRSPTHPLKNNGTEEELPDEADGKPICAAYPGELTPGRTSKSDMHFLPGRPPVGGIREKLSQNSHRGKATFSPLSDTAPNPALPNAFQNNSTRDHPTPPTSKHPEDRSDRRYRRKTRGRYHPEEIQQSPTPTVLCVIPKTRTKRILRTRSADPPRHELSACQRRRPKRTRRLKKEATRPQRRWDQFRDEKADGQATSAPCHHTGANPRNYRDERKLCRKKACRRPRRSAHRPVTVPAGEADPFADDIRSPAIRITTRQQGANAAIRQKPTTTSFPAGLQHTTSPTGESRKPGAQTSPPNNATGVCTGTPGQEPGRAEDLRVR